MTFLVIVTTPILSAFQVIVSPVFFVNSAAKKLDFYQWRSQDFKVGGTPVTWDAGWGFWGGAAQHALSPSARRSGESCHHPPPPKKKSRIYTNPVAMPVDGRGRVHPCAPVATLLYPS